MMRRIRIGGIVLLLAIQGCAGTPVQTTLPATADVTTTPPVAPEAESTATLPPQTVDPGETSAPVTPSISPSTAAVSDQRVAQIYFTDRQGIYEPETVYPLGIEEIFVVWSYEDMQPGDVVRRVWLNDGVIWVEKEETWNYDLYGSSGYRDDVSIFDRVDGLPAGDWQLQLYVNGVPQMAEERFFSIELTQEWMKASPDGSRMAWVENKKALVVDGVTLVEIGQDTPNRLGRFDWYPDSRHLLYTEIKRQLDWPTGPPGPRYELWAINVSDGQRTLISGEEDYVHAPVISPDGKHAAVVLGNGYGDACGAGLTLGIVSVRDDLTLSDSVSLRDFSGFAATFDDVYPVDAPDLERPGVWDDAAHLVVALRFTCTPPEAVLTMPGIYRISITDQTVDRIGDLPPE